MSVFISLRNKIKIYLINAISVFILLITSLVKLAVLNMKFKMKFNVKILT